MIFSFNLKNSKKSNLVYGVALLLLATQVACAETSSHKQEAIRESASTQPSTNVKAPSKEPTSPNAAPKWLKEKWDRSQSRPAEQTKFVASEWTNKNETFYLLASTQCCDIPTDLYTSNGMRVCTMSGGFAGNVEPACAEFKKTAKKVGSVQF